MLTAGCSWLDNLSYKVYAVHYAYTSDLQMSLGGQVAPVRTFSIVKVAFRSGLHTTIVVLAGNPICPLTACILLKDNNRDSPLLPFVLCTFFHVRVGHIEVDHSGQTLTSDTGLMTE